MPFFLCAEATLDVAVRATEPPCREWRYAGHDMNLCSSTEKSREASLWTLTFCMQNVVPMHVFCPQETILLASMWRILKPTKHESMLSAKQKREVELGEAVVIRLAAIASRLEAFTIRFPIQLGWKPLVMRSCFEDVNLLECCMAYHERDLYFRSSDWKIRKSK